MRVLVIGSTGTLGSAVVRALSPRHEVIGASRRADPRVNLEEPPTISALLASLSGLDAVVCCAGSARFRPLDQLEADDLRFSIASKLLGQVEVVRVALKHLNDGGSVTVTSGVLARKPMPGSAAISLVNAGLEGFVRAAALEAPRGIRVNVVSPPWVEETLQKLQMQAEGALSAAEVAKAYVAAVEGRHQGETLDPARFVGRA